MTGAKPISGTYCDLAIKFEGALQMLIEVKAIGLELKDNHVKQAVDYAANQGVEWVVIFAKPIDNELVVELNLLELNPKNEDHLDLVWLLAKEGWQKKGLGEYQMHRQALSRFFLGAVLLSDPVLEVVRRELRRLTPGAKIEVDEIETVLMQDVIKREVIEGEKADEARKQLGKAANRALKAKSKACDNDSPPVAPPTIVMQKPATAGDKPDA